MLRHTTQDRIAPRLRTALTLALLAAVTAAGRVDAQPAVDPFLAAEASGVRLAAYGVADGVSPTQGQGVSLTSGYNPPVEACYGAAGYCPPNAYGPNLAYDAPSAAWGWEVLPDGLIYRSYLAGPRESRMALHTFHNDSSANRSEWLWDATLGGRRGVLRFGNGDPANPTGWQLDIEGAATVRLNLDEARDVDASDFRFGVPLTYTDGGPMSYKMGYYHVSSHLGDEFIARTGVNSRINYVRDALIFGASYQANPCWRVYGEVAYAFFTAGGAEPWEVQFGAEYSKPGPTGFAGTPFFATNAHLREELDFGGDWTVQTGWLWRGVTGSTMRLGLHYLNGKSTQYQFFTNNEEQVGVGLWYDF